MQIKLRLICFVALLGVQPLFAQPTNFDEPPPVSSAPHPRSAKTAQWFERAQALMLRAISEVERAQYADELLVFKTFTEAYFQEINAWPVKGLWVRANYPCLQKLNALAWLNHSSGYVGDQTLPPRRFANGEKPQMLTELKAYLEALKIMRPSCIAAAPHYYSDGRADHVVGDFVDIQPSGTQLLVRLRTPLMTDQILLNHIKSTASANPPLAQAIQKWVNTLCVNKTAQAAMAGELTSSAKDPANTYQKPMLGNVTCAGHTIEPALLAAGLVEIDLANRITPDSHPEWFAALREARAAKRGIWANADPDLHLQPMPQPPKPLVAPAHLTPPTSGGAGDLCLDQTAWKLRAVVESDMPNQRREYVGVLCLDMPTIETRADASQKASTRAMQTVPIRGTSHWDCCPGPRSDVMVGTLSVHVSGTNIITLNRMLAGPHTIQSYTGTLQTVAGASSAQPSMVGTWTQAGIADGVLRSFVATPLNRLAFSYANPWFNNPY